MEDKGLLILTNISVGEYLLEEVNYSKLKINFITYRFSSEHSLHRKNKEI